MNSKTHSTASLFDWAAVREALRRTISTGNGPAIRTDEEMKNRDVEISVLINEVFGGEILKRHNGRGWHFYNRVNGECVDLTGQEVSHSCDKTGSVKNSKAPVNASGYFEQNDYTNFFLRFVSAFEETVGLGNYQPA